VIKPHLSKAYFAEKLKKNGIDNNDNNNSESRYVYRLKRHIIQESIYGVDIDASAIDIARLRLWLSLVVDEDDIDPIETLPNLDYKIVCGNSLIGMPENAMHDLNVEKELETLKEQFYNQTNETKKKTLRTQINAKIRELLDSAETFAGYKIDFDFKLFFSEVWHEKGGFDVVIGNPPYVNISKVDYKDILKKIKYEIYATTGDLYVLFYENGYKILKPNGNLNLITSNKWINASYGSKTRNFFAKKTSPQILIDFGRIRIFPNATVFVSILMLEKNKVTGNVDAVAIQGNLLPNIPLSSYFKKNKIKLSVKGKEIWKINSEKGLNINQKIQALGTPLKDWEGIEFFRGITTGFNKAFHINNETKNKILSEEPKSKEYTYPLLRGKDIKRWGYIFEEWYMLFIPWHFPLHNDVSISKASIEAEDSFKEEYPKLYNHLTKYRSELSRRNKDETGKRYEWYALQRYGANYWEEFIKPKIVWIEISDRANFSFDKKGHFLTNSAYFISGKNLNYLIAVLNSSIFDYYFFQITAKIAGGRKRYTKQYVEKVPIPQISKKEQYPYEMLVDYVINSKSLSNEISFNFFEQLLDAIVFELYFPEELKSANKEILKHLGDLKPLTDKMSEEEKLAIIQSEFERLYDPSHPVRNAIETLDSIEEVRIIKESLNH